MKKIILVEDDTFLAKMYYNKLSREDEFTVLAVERGGEAIKLITKELPDLVLLDIILPDLNGIQVLKQMKENAKTQAVAVIMLTNLNDKDYINAALSLGADGYLIKAHFTPNEVIDKIKKVLREKAKA